MKFVKTKLAKGGVLFSLRISAFLCVSAVNRLSAHIYRRGAEAQRNAEKKFELRHNLAKVELVKSRSRSWWAMISACLQKRHKGANDLNHSHAFGVSNCFEAGVSVELCQNVLDVIIHRRRADVELIGNCFCTVALRQIFQNFNLP